MDGSAERREPPEEVPFNVAADQARAALAATPPDVIRRNYYRWLRTRRDRGSSAPGEP
jgi:hypothetical protein